MRSFAQNPEWSIVTELKKQYDVSSVAPDSPIPGDTDVLLVAQPSSLTQKQMDNLTEYVKKGGATLLFLDPLPADPQTINLSPELPRQSPGGPFGGGPPPEPKGNLRPLLDMLNIDWPTIEIVWNGYNPHPQLDLPREIVFIGRGSGERDAFNSEQIASSGLQEIVTIFPGLLRSKSGGSGPEFTPLLRTSRSGGTLMWSEVVQQGFMGISGFNQRRRYIPTGVSYTLAARISGNAPADPATEATKKDETKKDETKKDAKATPPPAKLNAIAIADLDIIGEQFFGLRRNKIENLDFDNIPFVLNCVDVLAGDESVVGLRKKRSKHRTLVELEAQANQFKDQLQEETKRAENEARDELDASQKAFDKQVDEVKSRTDLDERTKEIQLSNLQDVAQRRLDVRKAVIEDEKQAKIRESKAESERKIRQIENTVRFAAGVLPPLPPLILGLFVWFARLRRENLGANPKRLA
jgi:ABC-2 type transport system permease protein